MVVLDGNSGSRKDPPLILSTSDRVLWEVLVLSFVRRPKICRVAAWKPSKENILWSVGGTDLLGSGTVQFYLSTILSSRNLLSGVSIYISIYNLPILCDYVTAYL